LAIFLIVIACAANYDIVDGFAWFAVLAIALSFLPAPLMLGVLWWDARERIAPLKKAANDLEARAITEE